MARCVQLAAKRCRTLSHVANTVADRLTLRIEADAIVFDPKQRLRALTRKAQPGACRLGVMRHVGQRLARQLKVFPRSAKELSKEIRRILDQAERTGGRLGT